MNCFLNCLIFLVPLQPSIPQFRKRTTTFGRFQKKTRKPQPAPRLHAAQHASSSYGSTGDTATSSSKLYQQQSIDEDDEDYENVTASGQIRQVEKIHYIVSSMASINQHNDYQCPLPNIFSHLLSVSIAFISLEESKGQKLKTEIIIPVIYLGILNQLLLWEKFLSALLAVCIMKGS